MAQPPCFVYSQFLYYVCKLQKALDGPKQAFQAWFQHLRETLLKCGIQHSITNSSMFLFRNNQHTLISLVYVDDIFLTGDSISLIQSLTSYLNKNFALKYLGDLHYFLGLEASCHGYVLYLTQLKYIHDLLV